LAARSILSLSQIYIALKHLRQGGHFVFVLSNKPDPSTIQALVLLRSLFTSITPCKGKSLHGIRSSFYLFCDTFDRQQYEERQVSELLLRGMADMREEEEKEEQRAIERVANRTAELSIDDVADTHGQIGSVATHPADLIWMPEITLSALLKQEGPFVSSFFEGLWNGQIRAIAKRTDELKYKNSRPSESNASRSAWRRTPVDSAWRAKAPDPAGTSIQGTWQTARRGGGPERNTETRKLDGASGAQNGAPARETSNALRNDWRKR
jgi:hypothetical protein